MKNYPFEHLKPIATEKPFNDLWPPGHLGEGFHFIQNRTLWFRWLKDGWLNNIPYRDTRLGAFYQQILAERKEKKAKEQRKRKLEARRRFRPYNRWTGYYRLRNRVVPIWKLVQNQG
jgi:hypothetical protein